MFKLTTKIPRRVAVAVSGGADSMAGLHFLNRVSGRVAAVVHVHHNTGDFADRSESLVENTCRGLGIPFMGMRLTTSPTKGESKEAFWRDHRYSFFDYCSKTTGCPIVTCHNLDDCLEEYVMNTVIRFSEHKRFISPNGPSNTIRPFLCWKKADMEEYCRKNFLNFVSDPANLDTSYLRVKVRMEIVPVLVNANPGIYKQVSKALLKGC